MTYNKLPGVYFTETSTTNVTSDQEYTPLFLIQTTTAIATIDEQLTEYTSFDDLATVCEGKGLTNTLDYIEDAILEGNINKFYVYSIKTDTAAGFTNAITGTAHVDDITSIIYVEETVSANNALSAKITAIKNAVEDNAENGAFRVAYIVPYATVEDAEEDNVAPEATCVSTLTTLLSGTGNGRICVTVPDTSAGTIIGKCISTPYDEEAGYTALETIQTSGLYNFTTDQMKTLQNLGVMFPRRETVQGVTQYRINLAVTTSFKESSGDGLLVSRTTADAVLREIGFKAQAFVKAKELETNAKQLEAETSNTIDSFVAEESIKRDGTSLVVADAGNNLFTISGQIQTVQSVIAIEVNTTITA